MVSPNFLGVKTENAIWPPDYMWYVGYQRHDDVTLSGHLRLNTRNLQAGDKCIQANLCIESVFSREFQLP